MSPLVDKLIFFVLRIVLKVHSFVYSLAGTLSQKVEKDGLHPKHRIMNYHKFFIDNVKENDVVLDIGCGNGALTYDVAKKVKKIVGIDLKKENIAIAKEKYSGENIKYIYGDAVTQVPKGNFNVIILSNVLEHIDGRVKFLASLKKLAPRFLIRAPMLNRSWIDLYKKELGLEYRLDNTHFIEYTFDSFEEEINKAGLHILNYSIQFGEIWAVINKKS